MSRPIILSYMLAMLILGILLGLALDAHATENPCAPGGEAPNFACFSPNPETRARVHITHAFPEEEVETAMRVSWCEARWIETAKNPTSSASGLFQLLRTWWGGKFDPFDPWLNSVEAARLVAADGWARHWYPSQDCWQ